MFQVLPHHLPVLIDFNPIFLLVDDFFEIMQMFVIIQEIAGNGDGLGIAIEIPFHQECGCYQEKRYAKGNQQYPLGNAVACQGNGNSQCLLSFLHALFLHFVV